MFGVNVFGTAGKRADKRLQDACEDLPVKEEGGRWRALSPPGRLERWEDETGKRLRPRPPPRREGRPESRRAPAAALASPCLGTAVGFKQHAKPTFKVMSLPTNHWPAPLWGAKAGVESCQFHVQSL